MRIYSFGGTQHGSGSGYPAAAHRWPDAKRYTDWREMLDKEGKRLNGITVSTPDHMHAPVTMTALQMGLATLPWAFKFAMGPLADALGAGRGRRRQLILAAEGTLERFTGDGMMIFCNDPVSVPNPAERALRMASST